MVMVMMTMSSHQYKIVIFTINLIDFCYQCPLIIIKLVRILFILVK